MHVIVSFSTDGGKTFPQVGMNNRWIIKDGRIKRYSTLLRHVDQIVRDYHPAKRRLAYQITDYISGAIIGTTQYKEQTDD